MSWFFLSLTAAITLATSDALTKKFFSHLSPYEMGLIRFIYALPLLVGAMFFIPWTTPDKTFFITIVVALPFEALAFFCYMTAIKKSPLSLTLPFLAFTPLFIILTGWVFLGETVTATGLFGIMMIVAGSYCLNLSHIATGYLEPFRAIIKEPGSRLMLLVSGIYSITATLGKLCILHSNPYVFGIVYFSIFTVLMLAAVPFVPGAHLKAIRALPWKGMLLGVTVAIMIFSHMLAISKIQAAYMISLKRTSLLFGVLYGAWWFKEEKIRERLTGAVIMVAGVFLIGWSGK
ncbi:MAG: EamA family transporter [Deltaproteobacteria bacterium]|nr:EamA family transporter [Deltaproteobacteria bacterium]